MASRGIKTIEELRDIVVSEMEAGHSDVLDVKATDMVGSTGMELHGIMVFRKKSETSVTIYLNSYWESYVSKEKSLLEIYNCIVNSALAEQSEKDKIKEIVSNYPAIKGLLKPMLVNYEANKIELEHRPHRQFLDLAIVLYIDLQEFHLNALSVSYELQRKWNADEDKMFDQAFQNLYETDRVVVKNLFSVLKEAKSVLTPKEIQELNRDIQAMVITKANKEYGAIYMVNKDILAIAAEKMNNDLFIYPSSTHEIIVVSEGWYDLSSKDIEMVNMQVVDQKDRLSNSVYRYNRKTGEVSIYEQGKVLENKGGKHDGSKKYNDRNNG